MEVDRWKQAQDLFHDLLDRDPRDRSVSLSRLDAGLRQEVLTLLAAYEASIATRPMTPAPGATAERRRIGTYTLVKELGEGGMGTVYLAERADAQFEKQVAIKLIRPGPGSHALIQRFYTERQILAGMEHPNIARLLDGGITEDGQPFLVMDYVDGERLDKYCDSRNLSIRARLELFRKVCAAVHYAHQSLVVHRDLKPSNILVSATGEPKLLDFGIAKVARTTRADSEQTATVGLFFTPLYASPELLQARHTTIGTDIYSLGVILYQLLTGRLPHDEFALRPVDLMNAVITGDPELPSTSAAKPLEHEESPEELARRRGCTPESLKRMLRGDLDGVTLKALAKTVAARYGSAEQFSEDVARYLNNEPVLARRHSAAYRTRKFIHRHWRGLSAAALVLALITFASVYSIRQQIHANQRFEETRAIANYLLFELFDQVSQLPGSTATRARMAKRAQTELDRLASLVRGNRGLQLETAVGYNRLAQIYGVAGNPNLGNIEAARENLKRAQTMLEDLRRNSPGERDIRAALAENLLLRSSMEMWSNGNTAAAQGLIEQAAKALEPADTSSSRWLQTHRFLRQKSAELFDLQERWKDQEEVTGKGLEELAAWPEAMRQDEAYVESNARLLRLRGNSFYYQKHISDALNIYQQAYLMLTAAAGKWPNRPGILHQLLYVGYDVGSTFDTLKDLPRALEAMQMSTDAGRQLVQIDDRDQNVRRAYFVSRQAYAELLQEVGRTAEAIREQAAVVAERRAQAQRQPGLAQSSRDVAFSIMVLAKLNWTSDRPQACVMARQSLAIFEELNKKGALVAWDWSENAGMDRRLLAQCPAQGISSGKGTTR